MIVPRFDWSFVLILWLCLCAGKVRGKKPTVSICGFDDVLGNLAKRADFVNKADSEAASGSLESVVDGIRTATTTISGSTTNTTRQRQRCFALHGSNPAVHVFLEKTVNVSFVLVYAAADDENESLQELMKGLQVRVGSQLCVRDIRVGQQREMALIHAVCDTPLNGSRVTLKLPGENRTLRLCEVEVYDMTCDCLEGCEDQGFCFAPCARNDRCKRENVAISQSTSSSPLSDRSGPSKLVVNGNTGTIFVSRKDNDDVNEQNCILSQGGSSYSLQANGSSSNARKKRQTSSGTYVNPWWSVEMENLVAVRGVVIYRANAEQVWETETFTEVSVDGERCAKYGPDYITRDEAIRPRLVLKCDRVIRGHKVEITRLPVSRTVLPAPLQLCEVQIWSCTAGWYGDQCNIKCGWCAGGRDTCDTVTGDCPDGCAARWYGSTCKRRCRNSCVSRQCNQTTGHCLQCPPNRDLPFCQECSAGWYGSACDQTCGSCVNNTSCDAITGHCDLGCAPGFLPPFCVEEFTTTPAMTSTMANNNTTDKNVSSVAVVAGAVVGTLVVVAVVLLLLFFVWYRKRRGGLKTKNQNPAPAVPHAGVTKPEATKTESFTYLEIIPPTTPTDLAAVNHDVTASHDATTGENSYETLDMSTYENVEGNEDHVYVMPVFSRGDSLSSNASGAYVNMGYTQSN